MSKLHTFLLIDPSLRFLLKKLANTKYVDAWELWWTQCKEPGYIYIQKTIQNTFFLSPQKQYILSEIFRRCLQGNKSKEHCQLCQGLLLSLSIAHVKQAACMLPPHVSRMPFSQDTHAYLCQSSGSQAAQIFRYCLVIAGSLWSLPLAVYTFFRIHHYMFFSCRTLSIIT